MRTPARRRVALPPLASPPSPARPAERKGKLRAAAADAKKEVDEYKAQREAKLRTVQPEVSAGAPRAAARATPRPSCRAAADARRPRRPHDARPQAYALEQRVSRLTRETDGKIASLECVPRARRGAPGRRAPARHRRLARSAAAPTRRRPAPAPSALHDLCCAHATAAAVVAAAARAPSRRPATAPPDARRSHSDAPSRTRRNEFARTKEPVLNLLMQVVMSIDNPFAGKQ